MIVCADDYGLSDQIDCAILELAATRKLSAVSCMTVLERCSPAALGRLLEYEEGLDLGLHLCLTEEHLASSTAAGLATPLPLFASFGGLFRQCLRRQITPREIAPHVSSQYELFVRKCGRRPDFIDGHLYVHQLPGVREALLEFVLSLPADARPYIRNTRLRFQALWRRGLPWLKAGAIGIFGARMFKLLEGSGVPTNHGFAGIYDFRRWRNYGRYLPAFVDCLPEPNGLLVVHPGQAENWRCQEYETLKNFRFPEGQPGRFRR